MKHSRIATICAAALTFGMLSPLPAQAAVIGGNVTGGTSGGSFVNLGFNPPAATGNNNQQSPNLFAFNEDQNIVLTQDVAVDFCANPGVCGGGFLTTGLTVASHYIIFDPSANRTITGNVIFDATILAIMSTTANMAASDFLANTGVQYNSPNLRGLESSDSVSASGNTLTLDFFANSPGDYVRVITAFSPIAAPAPGALALFGVGILGLGLRRRLSRV